MIKYIFREDEPLRIKAAHKADAQIIGTALETIRVSAGGELEPKRIVDTARDKKHPLHVHFEWDDILAGEAYRLEQARSLVRIVRVVDEEVDEGSTRAFISVNLPKSGVSYRTASDVRNSRDLAEAVLAQAERDNGYRWGMARQARQVALRPGAERNVDIRR
jgi:hypothetical protein